MLLAFGHIDRAVVENVRHPRRLALFGADAHERAIPRRKPYHSGRGMDWLKIKSVRSESFAIFGYEPSANALGKLGRLLLTAMKGGSLVYSALIAGLGARRLSRK